MKTNNFLLANCKTQEDLAIIIKLMNEIEWDKMKREFKEKN